MKIDENIEEWQEKLDIEEETPSDADLRRFKEKCLFIITMLAIVLSFIGWELFIAFNPDSPYLGTVLNGGFGLIMAFLGYWARGSQ